MVAALVLGIVAAAVVTNGGDGDDGGEGGVTTGSQTVTPAAGEPEANTPPDRWTPAGDVVQGGEIVDVSTFANGLPENVDPLLATSFSEAQIANSLYDGLTAVDYSDPLQPAVRGAVAEQWSTNEDASVWTFTLRPGLRFSDGTPVLPSSFERAWEIGSSPEVADVAPYSYQYALIDGGQAKLDGEADDLTGVEADDEAMTLTVRLAEPHAQFDMVVSHRSFYPMPTARDELGDQLAWQDREMVGNGPFVLEGTFSPDADMVMVPNPEWDGTAYAAVLALPPDPYLDRVTFRHVTDPEQAYAMLAVGEVDVAPLPSSAFTTGAEGYGIDLEQPALGVYFFQINLNDPRVGGEENRELRQAISQAIDREAINEAIYGGTRSVPSGFTPPGVQGFQEDLCDYCRHDPGAAEAAFQEWQDQGNSLDGPLPIQFNEGFGHEEVVQLVIENLEAVGIEARPDPRPSDDYFQDLADGECVVCRNGWLADLPTYESFLYELFHSQADSGSNFGVSDAELDSLIDDARAELDPDRRVDLYRQAEQVLVNDQIAAVPIYWYTPFLVYDTERIANFQEDPDFDVSWETIYLTE